MNKSSFKYIYGPVYSWRLGMSLGVDPISKTEKICNYDCMYCQLGSTICFSSKREEFVSTKEILKEIESIDGVDIDYITFSGRGEPTLAKNLGEMILEIKKSRREKIAVITNSSLMDRADVRDDLMSCDFVLAKLDSFDQESFSDINLPMDAINFDAIIDGLIAFKKSFNGKFALQIMFVDKNEGSAKKIAEVARKIAPDEVQINTPLRPCGTKPLTKIQMDGIKKYFLGLNIVCIYDVEQKQYAPLDDQKTADRHGKFKNS